MGFAVVFLTTSSHNSFYLSTSKIWAFHETKFTSPSNLSLVLNPKEVIFSKNKFQQIVLLSQRFFWILEMTVSLQIFNFLSHSALIPCRFLQVFSLRFISKICHSLFHSQKNKWLEINIKFSNLKHCCNFTFSLTENK